MRMMLIELRKTFGNVRIYLSAVCIAAAYLLGMITELQKYYYNYSIDTLLQNMFDHVYVLFLYMLGIVGGGFFYCMEEKNGCLSYVVHRTTVTRYAVAKTTASYLGGFVCTVLGDLFTVCAAIPVLWFRYHDWTLVFIGRGGPTDLPGNAGLLILKALYVGLLSSIAYLITTIYPNYFIGMVMPLLLHYAYIVLCNWVTPPCFLDIRKIFDLVGGLFATLPQLFLYAVFYCICVCSVICLISIRFIHRRLERG